MYVIGGEGSDGPLKDVWRSEDGAHWTMTEVWCGVICVCVCMSPASPLPRPLLCLFFFQVSDFFHRNETDSISVKFRFSLDWKECRDW